MYSIVLMAATAAGPNSPAADVAPPVVVAPVAAGCCGGSVVAGCTGYAAGCYGSCYGGVSYGCCGGRVGHFHKHRASYGCCGGYGYGYGGCCGWSCFGSCYGSYSYGAWGSCYGSYSYGGCGGCYGAYSYHYGCYGSGYMPPVAPAVVIPVETAPAPKSDTTPKTGAGKDGASLRFQLPANAALFVDGQRVGGDGAERAFFTPPLQAGQRYFYDVKAEVVVAGQTVTEEKRVVVSAGAELVESFPRLLAATTNPATVAGR